MSYPKALQNGNRERVESTPANEYHLIQPVSSPTHYDNSQKIINNLNKILMSSKKRMLERKARQNDSKREKIRQLLKYHMNKSDTQKK